MYFECVGTTALPAWYELGLREKDYCLEITTTPEIWETTSAALITAPIRKYLEQTRKVEPFIVPGALPWGFGPAFIFDEATSNSQVTLLCELPKCEEGTQGWWSRASSVCATVSLLLDYIHHVHQEETTHLPYIQLLEILPGFSYEDNRCHLALATGVSAALHAWLCKYPKHTYLQAATDAMRCAYEYMRGKSLDEFDLSNTHVLVRENGFLSLNCPGDRCGIFVSHEFGSRQPSATGYEMYDHNLDSPLQFFTLLVGLAALNQQARENGL